MRAVTSTWLQQKKIVKQHTTRSWIHQQDFDEHPTFRVTAMPKFLTFPRYFRLSHLQFHDAEAMDKIHKLALAIRDDCLYSNHQLLQPSKSTFRFTLQCLQLYTSTLVPHWLKRNATISSSKTYGLITGLMVVLVSSPVVHCTLFKGHQGRFASTDGVP